MQDPAIETFLDDADAIEGIALVMRQASIVDYQGELVPACKFSAAQARALARALLVLARELDDAQ
jgi:hypothetical protein